MTGKEEGCSAEYKIREILSKSLRAHYQRRQFKVMETSVELLFNSPQGAVSVLLCVTIVILDACYYNNGQSMSAVLGPSSTWTGSSWSLLLPAVLTVCQPTLCWWDGIRRG